MNYRNNGNQSKSRRIRKLNITCKKGDTFILSLLMKDSDGDALMSADTGS